MDVNKTGGLSMINKLDENIEFLLGEKALIESAFGQAFRQRLLSELVFSKEEIEGIHFKIATSLEEKEMARKLVHDSYVALSYISLLPQGMQFSLFQMLPGTTTLIALRDEKVIGTVSLVEDSDIGLPIDELHGADIDRLRRYGRHLAEVSSLAVDRNLRNKGIHFILFNMLFQWARRHRSVEELVVWALPKTLTFYKNILLFRQLGPGLRDDTMSGIITTPLGNSVDLLYKMYQKLYDNDQYEINLLGRKLTLFEFLIYCEDNPLFSLWDAPRIKGYPYQLNMPPALTADDIRKHMKNCDIDPDSLQGSHKVMLDRICSA